MEKVAVLGKHTAGLPARAAMDRWDGVRVCVEGGGPEVGQRATAKGQR
jgi:hypothetical protein